MKTGYRSVQTAESLCNEAPDCCFQPIGEDVLNPLCEVQLRHVAAGFLRDRSREYTCEG
jgi:hypothetical protein